ncbi:MAG: hypothetical protein QGI94_02100 [Candidatus Scalindua sp.]|jgi:hypothetical protein|nr:hypothetical protein [Candidatus Scalindua sp.]
MNKEKQKLSSIESDLLECYKKHQPVLLYGEDKVGRKDLLLKIHKANGGLDQRQEFDKDDGEFSFGRNTVRTWDYVNLAWHDSAYIYDILTYEQDDPHWLGEMSYYDEGYFYACKGMLFLDNLLCNDENKLIYHKLATAIESGNACYNWLVVYTESLDGMSQYFKEQFKTIFLDSKEAVIAPVEKIPETEGQGIIPIETLLSYDKTTGKFTFGNLESIAVSPTSRAKVRTMAEKLMKWWRNGKPCSLGEFGIDPTKKTPTHVYDNMSNIRKVLEDIKVNMPQCADGKYPPPSEPEHFDIINNS